MLCWYVLWEDTRTKKHLEAPFSERMRVFLEQDVCADYVKSKAEELGLQFMFTTFELPTTPGIKNLVQGAALLEVTCLEVSTSNGANDGT